MLSLAVGGTAAAAPADLDPTFSGDGKAFTDFGNQWDSVNAVAIQSDGKIVAAGTAAEDTSAGDFAVARYNPDGSPDTTFSGNGQVTTDFGFEDRGADVAIQADGKIVVAGSAATGLGGRGFALARYNPDGSLDPTFSGDGKQTAGFGGDGYGVAIQPDGKIVVVGVGNGDFALVRYDPQGSLDPSFSGDGIQTTDMGFSDVASDVGIAADGSIVVSGYSSWGGGSFFLVARYSSTGVRDIAFPDYDQIQDPPFGGDGIATALAIQPDGKVVAAGYAFFTTQPNRDFVVARYNEDGSLDPTFAGDGTQVTETGNEMQAFDTAIAPDGRILVAGFLRVLDETEDFAIARYEPSGALDLGFSGDGIQTTDFDGAYDVAYGVAVQADSKIVAAGASNGEFAVVRYRGDAPPDTTPPETRIISGPADGRWINDATPTFTYFTEDVTAIFECRHDGGSWRACTGPGNSDTTETLADGIHAFEVRAKDLSGNVDASPAIRRFAVDTHAPGTTITGRISKTRDRTPTFRFSVSEDYAISYCTVDERRVLGCSSKFTSKRLSPGSHTFRVTSIDRAGNAGTTARDMFKIRKRQR